MDRIRRVDAVVASRLCLGCGACSSICPDAIVQLEGIDREGIRPVVTRESCGSCSMCVDVCPAVMTDFETLDRPAPAFAALKPEWGTILEIWEGHATDPEIRFKGSSGGALTALSLYCLEVLGMHGVLHTGADPNDPTKNSTRLSRDREALMRATGSRYSPASVCDRVVWIEEAPAPCVFVGKPVDVVGLRKLQGLRPRLHENVGLVLSFFCAETPSRQGTLELLEQMRVRPEDLENLRYRGHGWPGSFTPQVRGQEAGRSAPSMSYRESWAFLQAFRPWSAHLWPDGTGELADISCGDPWYEEPDGVDPGFSLIVVRTEAGRSVLRGAIESGYLQVVPAGPEKLVGSQDELRRKKASIWGRLLAMRLFCLPVPRYEGMPLLTLWRRLPWKTQAKSVLGTIRRILRRRLWRPLRIRRLSSDPDPDPA